MKKPTRENPLSRAGLRVSQAPGKEAPGAPYTELLGPSSAPSLRAGWNAGIVGFLILGLLISTLSGCTRTQNISKARIIVVASFLPIWTITKQVTQGIPGVDVQLLLPPGMGGPHDFSLTVTQAVLLEKADVLVMNGLGLERFLEGISSLQRPNLSIICATETVDTIGLPAMWEVHQSKDGAHEDFSTNHHAWVSPKQEIVMTRCVAEHFARIDTQFADQYRINADYYIARLDSLDFRFKGLVDQARNKRIVTLHPAFDYLARDYGLEIVAVIESDPGVAPSAKDLTEIIEKIRQTRPAAIFLEPNASDRMAQTISTETGIPLRVLDPVETGPTDPDAYLMAMWKNLQSLGIALLVTN